MKDYTITYKTGKSEKITVEDKLTLINEFFEGDESQFKDLVAKLSWSSLSTFYVEDVQANKVHAEIFTADVNPYGWRNQ